MAFSLCLLIKPRLFALAFWFALPVVVVYYLKGEFTLSAKGYAFDSVFARFLTNPIILEFGFGALAGFMYKKVSHYVEGKSALVSILIATAIGMAIYTRELTAYNLLSGIAFSILVLTFALYSNAVTRFFPQFLITLGNISFSLYLIQNPLAGFISGKAEKLLPGSMHGVPGFVALITISILVAYLTYHYVEVKLTQFLRNKLHTGRISALEDNPVSS
ncbi:acyltransferase family protein [Erwinia tracheiphila]|uniref:acyltransferase family protein n=1 Tax=Erwinia tracheiphila TaxID=65700 RepID=UPI000685A4C7|nr:acyltransferase family protein [Erwinia tracheiphila]